MDVRVYQQGDIHRLPIRSGDLFDCVPESVIMSGMANSVFIDGEIAAVGGVIPLYKGVGTLWSYVSDRMRGHGVELVRFLRREIPIVMKNLGLHRLHVTVQCHLDEYVQFSRLLGFEIESRMKAASPDGRDMYMMAIVRLENVGC